MNQKEPLSTFIIDREDQAVDPTTLVSEGLSIGRQPDCELILNHPTVSRLHAGIKEVDGRFYIFHLSPSNSTTVNGRAVEGKEALAEGDVIQLGPFFLYVSQERDALSLRVIYQTAVRIGDADVEGENPEQHPPPGTPPAGKIDKQTGEALDVFWKARQREKGKITRPSPLRPHAPPRLGKARFNWTPTRDLVRPWPYAILTWAAVVVAALTVLASFTFTTAFSPTPVSNPHTRAALTLTPAIARQPNGNTCTACHAVKSHMNDNCAGCHTTDAFKATITQPHVAAGIGCTSCHAEHRGANFRPGLQPMNANFQRGVEPDETCAGCHNDANKRLYNGKAVHTPHGGTFGYPLINGEWKWEGIDQLELAQKPEDFRKRIEQFKALWPGQAANQIRNAEFHALHVGRLLTVNGLKGDSAGHVSCSTCHTSLGNALDRTTPRQTCGACHNGYMDPQTGQQVIAQDRPNCNSCHTQHPADKRPWNRSLFVNPPQLAGGPLSPPAATVSALARVAH